MGTKLKALALALMLLAVTMIVASPAATAAPAAAAAVAEPAMILDAPAPSAAQLAANYLTTNYVVDPSSPGPGVYCIWYYPWPPEPGWDPAQHWTAFVPRGYWAEQVGTYPWMCTLGTGPGADGDGFWIDRNHRVEVYKWAVSTGYPYTGNWYYTGQVIRGGQSLMFTTSGNYMLRVQNGA